MSYHVQVSLEGKTGAPRDRIVNTFSVEATPGADPTREAGIANAFRDFYLIAPASKTRMADFLSRAIERTGAVHTVKVYNIETNAQELGTAPLGTPVKVLPFTLPAAPFGPFSLPNELAVVLSLEAIGHDTAAVEVDDGNAATPNPRPRSRRKGRVYLGSLNSTALDTTADQNNEGRVAVNFQTSIVAAVADLRDRLAAVSATTKLGVWSRADGDVIAVQACSVDNSFDVVRSRSQVATNRTRVLL